MSPLKEKNNDSAVEDNIQSLFDKLSDFLFILDGQRNIIHVNDSASQSLGFSKETIQKMGILELIDTLSHSDFQILMELTQPEQKAIANIDFISDDGVVTPTETSITSGLWRGQDVIFVTASSYKERLNLLETLRRERKAYALIAEAAVATETIQELCSTVILGLVDTLGYDLGTVRILDKTQICLRLEAVVGLSPDNVTHEVALDDQTFLGAQVARDKRAVFADDVKTHPIAKTRIERINEIGLESIIFWPLLDEDGNLLGVCNIGSRTKKELLEVERAFFETVAGMFSTVLDRRLKAQSLKDSQEQFIAFADHIPGPVYIKDQDSRLLFANRFMTGPSGDTTEWRGKTNFDIFPNKTIAEERTKEDKLVLQEGLITRITQRRMSSGKPGFFRTYKFPIHLEGNPPLIGGFSIDITEQRIAEQKMKEEKARAEFFTDLMGHDLNNMHQGIMSSLELLLVKENVSGYTEEMIKRALSQVQRSVELIGHVRRFSFLQNQAIEFHDRDLYTDAVNAIEAVVESFPERKINVKLNFVSNQFSVKGDEFLFDVLYNLIHNSVKYDQNDPVRIFLNASLSKDEKFVKLEIEDSGPGIPDDLKNTVLSKLEEQPANRQGIGLTLVSQIVEKYKGKIQIEDKIQNEPGSGTRITVYFPT
ncbi:MAG: ATP-binding protein [Candidatus Thorarchaeota archaeon]